MEPPYSLRHVCCSPSPIREHGRAYTVTAPAGWLADQTSSRKWPFLGGLIALAGSSLMFCLSTSIVLLVTARVLQGMTAAVVWVIGLALLIDSVGLSEIGNALGYATLGWTTAVLVGPLLGGVVYERAGYYAVWYMVFGVILLDILLRLFMIEKKTAKKWLEPEPEPQAVGPGTGEKRISTRSEVTQSVESQAPEGATDASRDDERATSTTKRSGLAPIFTLLRSRRFLNALWATFVQATLISAFDSVVPLHVEHTFGWNSTGAGLIFLSIIMPNLLSPLIGTLADKYGPRWFATAGFFFCCPALVLLRLVDSPGIGKVVLLCALLALSGFTLSLGIVPMMAEFAHVVVAKKKENPGIYGKTGAYAQAYGLFNMCYAAGCLVGPIWSGMLVDRAGWGTMSWSLGLLSGLTTIPVVLLTGGWIFGKRERRETSVDSADQV